MDEQTQLEMDAAAFRSLVKHLQQRKDVQNIELMNLAGFCRNCLAKWYMKAGKARGVELSYDQAREYIYGMAYDEWKRNYQTEATPEQLKKFEATKSKHAF